jgi:hypothetical protein
VPSARRYQEIHVERIKVELRLESRATQAGKRELPPTDSTSLDPVEHEIVEKFEGERKVQLDEFLGHLKVRQDQLVEYQIGPTATEATAVAQDAEARFHALRTRRLEELFRLREDVLAADADLRNFRRDHGLDRPAHYPESKLLHIAILALLVAIEAPFSGYMFAQSSEQGLLGGLTVALGFAALNVFFAWTMGRATLPWLHYHRLAPKIAAVFGAPVLFLVLTGGFNIVLANYREIAQRTPDYAGRETMQRLRADPFGLEEFESWLLLILGVSFGLIAMVDGYRWDDPYPGYGRRDRHLRAREADYVLAKDSAFEDVEALRDEELQKLDAVTEDLRQRQNTYQGLRQVLDAEVRQFEAHIGYLERTCDLLLSTYRQLNRAARSTPPPRYFTERFTFPNSVTADLGGLTMAPDEREGTYALLGHHLEDIEQARSRVLRAHATTFKSFTALGDLVANGKDYKATA